jgi:hypothetical protein
MRQIGRCLPRSRSAAVRAAEPASAGLESDRHPPITGGGRSNRLVSDYRCLLSSLAQCTVFATSPPIIGTISLF